MKTHVWKSEFSVLSSSLRRLLLSSLMVVISSRAYGQSSALTECTRAFYRGDYALAVQLAEKHLRKYPKDVPVRVDRKSVVRERVENRGDVLAIKNIDNGQSD